jgi:SAM-dependent methyltransferase
MKNFDKDLYKKFNKDLQNLNDDQLISHYLASQHEARLYGETKSTVEFFSMRWLRGEGLEIGAGRNPTPLFGQTAITYCDIDMDHNFGGSNSKVIISVDAKNFNPSFNQKFDFVVCSHVLEHADSFIRALENLLSIVRGGGIIYLVLPDIDFLHDKNWLPNFDFDHHIDEYENPLAYAEIHDQLYIDTVIDYIDSSNNEHALLTDAYRWAIKQRKIPDSMRFMHHKHNYNLEGWIKTLLKVQNFIGNKFSISDIGYGHERKDIHFILQSLG